MADAKKKEARTQEHNDVQFSRARLTDDDPRVADKERELRNKPMPEEYRSDPSKLAGWPVPEDRLPAVMRADQEGDHDYQLETYDEIDDKHRDRELTAGTGTVAADTFARTLRENPTQDLNEVQAPPTTAAVAAAEGDGATSDPVPVVDRKTGEQLNGPAPNKSTAQRDNK